MVTCSFCSCGAPCDIHNKGYRVEVEPATPADRAAPPAHRAIRRSPSKPHLRLHYLSPESPFSWAWRVSLVRGPVAQFTTVRHCTGIELSTALELARKYWF